MPAAPDHERPAALLRDGRYQEAELLLRELLQADSNDPVLMEMLAKALRRQGRAAEALNCCEPVLATFPGRASAWREAGRNCNNLGQLSRARKSLEKAGSLATADAELEASISLELGHVCQRLGDIRSARRAFARAAGQRPEWAAPHLRLGLLDLDASNFAAAEEAIGQAVQLDKDNSEAWTALGVARHRQGKNAPASKAYRHALTLDPGNPEAMVNLAISLHDDGKLAAAIAGYEQVLEIAPGDPRAANHLADALLEAGECERSLAVADRFLQRFPGNSGALSSRSVALLRLGRKRDYEALVNLQELILPVDIETPAGYASLAEFNAALAKHVQEHESLRYEPAGHATRRGHHTADLLRFEKGPVAALEHAIALAIDEYKRHLQLLPGHPVNAAAAAGWRLSLWSVVMGSAGHQLPHVHPSAWLSGVYYAQLPGIISAADSAQAGWIEFGPPPATLAGDTDFPIRRLQPRAGRMFLFPAFLYHQTVPFVSDEVRISLAFDVAPAAGSSANIVGA